LISTPSAYTALRREIDENIASGRISSPVITDAEADALPYLQAVIREGMRMWPPTTGFGSKQVPKGGDVICGYHVPEGTQVAQNFWGMMRLKSIWGEDADAFRPERWLEAKSQGKEKVWNSVVELDFGSGKYQCLGKRIALMELNKIFVEVCWIFPFDFFFFFCSLLSEANNDSNQAPSTIRFCPRRPPNPRWVQEWSLLGVERGLAEGIQQREMTSRAGAGLSATRPSVGHW